jgi:hypothetical protein
MARDFDSVERQVFDVVQSYPVPPTKKQIRLKLSHLDGHAVNVSINALRKRRCIAKIPYAGFYVPNKDE